MGRNSQEKYTFVQEIRIAERTDPKGAGQCIYGFERVFLSFPNNLDDGVAAREGTPVSQGGALLPKVREIGLLREFQGLSGIVSKTSSKPLGSRYCYMLEVVRVFSWSTDSMVRCSSSEAFESDDRSRKTQ